MQTLLRVKPSEMREALDVRIIGLRRQSNDMVAIACLPPEILSSIFVECVRGEVASAMQEVPSLSVWVTLTQICHRWRMVALGTPTLWNTISLTPTSCSEQVEAWLVRSGQGFLFVKVMARRTCAKIQLFDRILQELQRIRELQLDSTSCALTSIHWPNSPALNLKYLKITQATHREGVDLDWTAPFPMTFQALFPALQTLDLRNCGLIFGKLALPSTLTRLEISNRSPIPSSIAEVLQALRGLTSLETLVLEHTLQPDSSSPKVADPADFPHLTSLVLHGHGLSHIRLLDLLRFPSTIRLSLDLLLAGPWVSSCTLIASSLSSVLGKALDISSLYISTRSYDEWTKPGIKFKAWRGMQSLDDLKQTGYIAHNADVNIHFFHDWAPAVDDILTELVGSVVAKLSVEKVRTMLVDCVDGPFFYTPGFYPRFTELEVFGLLGTGGTGNRSALDILRILEREDGKQYLQNLRIIHVDSMIFHDVESRFTKVFEDRRDSGHPCKLEVERCFDVRENFIESLRAVTEVDWDGQTEVFYSSEDQSDHESEEEENASTEVWGESESEDSEVVSDDGTDLWE